MTTGNFRGKSEGKYQSQNISIRYSAGKDK